jgi:hypothetical protein
MKSATLLTAASLRAMLIVSVGGKLEMSAIARGLFPMRSRLQRTRHSGGTPDARPERT